MFHSHNLYYLYRVNFGELVLVWLYHTYHIQIHGKYKPIRYMNPNKELEHNPNEYIQLSTLKLLYFLPNLILLQHFYLKLFLQDINVIIDAFLFGLIFLRILVIHSIRFVKLILVEVMKYQLTYKYFYDNGSNH